MRVHTVHLIADTDPAPVLDKGGFPTSLDTSERYWHMLSSYEEAWPWVREVAQRRAVGAYTRWLGFGTDAPFVVYFTPDGRDITPSQPFPLILPVSLAGRPLMTLFGVYYFLEKMKGVEASQILAGLDDF